MRYIESEHEIIVSNENLTTLESLPKFTNLKHLNVSFNTLQSLNGIEQARLLYNLNISHNCVTSLEGVQQLHQLRILKCSDNQISELNYLKGLRNLEELWISNNQINQVEFCHLSLLSSLRVLMLHPNPCTKDCHYRMSLIQLMPNLTWIDTRIDEQWRLHRTNDFAAPISQTFRENCITSSLDEDIYPQESNSNNNTPYVLPPIQVATVSMFDRKLAKRMAVEKELLRFPVQSATENQLDIHEESPSNLSQQDTSQLNDIDQNLPLLRGAAPNTLPLIVATPTTSRSNVNSIGGQEKAKSIANAILSLPNLEKFGDNRQEALCRTKTRYKKATKDRKSSHNQDIPIELSNHEYGYQCGEGAKPNDERVEEGAEFVLKYSNTSTPAVHIRNDGSCLAKYPNSTVAIKVDSCDADDESVNKLQRIYAATKEGLVALSFDKFGSGFINYLPSGKLMLSTTSIGDGVYFSPTGQTMRQWNIRDGVLQITDLQLNQVDGLGDGINGELVVKLSDALGVKIQLVPSNQRVLPHITLYFAVDNIRHAFRNYGNTCTSTAEECETVFGKLRMNDTQQETKENKIGTEISHLDFLDQIRAAVAKLC